MKFVDYPVVERDPTLFEVLQQGQLYFLNYIKNNTGFGNNKSIIKINNIRGSYRNDVDTINCKLRYDTDQLELFVSYWEAIGYYSFQQLMS